MVGASHKEAPSLRFHLLRELTRLASARVLDLPGKGHAFLHHPERSAGVGHADRG